MKRTLVLLLTVVMCLSLLAACGTPTETPASTAPASTAPASTAPASTAPAETPAGPVEITVISMFGGEDGNAANYKAAIAEYTAATGNTVLDLSATANDAWNAQVLSDFAAGADPDVLHFFAGGVSEALITGNKLVTIDEIRAVYPDYLSNISDAAIAQLANMTKDGGNYFAPSNGFWEATFVNLDVLEAAGVSEIPQTWDAFLDACEKIKASGKTPIAVEFAEEPMYLFEFLLYNYAGANLGTTTPKAVGDDAYKMYVKAIEDYKELYDKGYLPKNCMTATRQEVQQTFAEKKTAFYPGGQWNRGAVEELFEDTTTAGAMGFPVKDANSARASSALLGGYSTGFAITRKAWEDPTKQKACVDYLNSILQDHNLNAFSSGGLAAMPSKNPPVLEGEITVFTQNCLDAVNDAEAWAMPAEEVWPAPAKILFFNDLLGKMVSSAITIEDGLGQFITALNG